MSADRPDPPRNKRLCASLSASFPLGFGLQAKKKEGEEEEIPRCAEMMATPLHFAGVGFNKSNKKIHIYFCGMPYFQLLTTDTMMNLFMAFFG